MNNYLITGASRGIGRSVAALLAQKDRKLFVHGRDESALLQTQALVTSKGAEAIPLVAELATTAGVESLISSVKDAGIDVLVNNAGIPSATMLENISDEEWQHVFAVNVTAPFKLAQALVPSIPRGGAIVNILSVGAQKGFPGWSAYCMSKYALKGFAIALREEVRDRGIRVINIYPGGVLTDIWKAVEGEWPLDAMMSPDEVARAVKFSLEAAPGVVADEINIRNIGDF